jgi:hypothetical protein
MKKKKGVIDPYVFKPLQKVMTEEHKKQLGKHFIEFGYKLAKDKSGKNIDDVISNIEEVLKQMKLLKQKFYE